METEGKLQKLITCKICMVCGKRKSIFEFYRILEMKIIYNICFECMENKIKDEHSKKKEKCC